ncbi:SufD family Fe-S cluster assembly protein [Candidatus Saccharibacteria bacterium]|nr:SufD family Fe-S cluster assembly protein [Candidatus Saccharibacteria bacterium]
MADNDVSRESGAWQGEDERASPVATGASDAARETLFQPLVPDGAYNFRVNGKSVGRKSTANIDIKTKQGKSGLDIYIKPGTKGETVHIPVAISATGLKEAVYNDFHIGENSEVTIIAGCGIYNCGPSDSVHDGIHRFYVGNNSKIKYIEKHYGFGQGRGGKILNPTTEVYLEKGSEATLELEQIKGVDSTIRTTTADLKDNAKLVVKERLFTHGRQTAESIYEINLNGRNSTADLASRSIAQDLSKQTFRATIVGNNICRGHSECDAIIMDGARVHAIPALDAKTKDAELIHEAAIGKLASDQIEKLMTLGLTRKEAESKIINGFLK